MSELEQYKKAYATLVGDVDAIITNLKLTGTGFTQEEILANLTAKKLIKALQDAEEIFLTEALDDE